MSSWQDDLDDNAVQIVEDLAKNANFIDYQINVSPASNKGDNYLGVVYRVGVTGTKYGKKNIKWSFILKACPKYARKIPLEFIYKREFFVYDTMLPSLCSMEADFGVPVEDRFKFTACLGGDMTYMKELIVLDDLKTEGYVMGSRKESLSFEQMTLLLKSLANLHAMSFALQQYNPEKHKKFVDLVTIENEFGEQFEGFLVGGVKNAANAMVDERTKKMVEDFGMGIYKKLLSYVVPDESMAYKVLCHGDCWTNNVMFRFEDNKPVEVRLLDWQMVKHASPILDVAYLIFCSTDEKLRGQHYDELLDIYYKHMKMCLNRLGCDINVCYPEHVFKQQIRDVMPFGLIMAIITAPMFMCDEEDVPDMGEMMKKDDFDEEDLKLKNAKSQVRYENRIRGVVNDFIRLELI